jgi:hypothetical protein
MSRSLFLLIAILTAGCVRVADNQQEGLIEEPDPVEGVLCMGFDMSGPFRQQIQADNGRVGKFALSVVADFFKARAGSNDQVVLFQISGNMDRPIMWQGRPAEFRSRFGDPAAFRSFLADKARAPEDRCPAFRGIAEALEYVLSFHERPGSKVATATLVFSSFLDTDPDSAVQLERMKDALRRYSKVTAGIGFYWIDNKVAPKIEKILRESGYPNAATRDFVDYPDKPIWR